MNGSKRLFVRFLKYRRKKCNITYLIHSCIFYKHYKNACLLFNFLKPSLYLSIAPCMIKTLNTNVLYKIFRIIPKDRFKYIFVLLCNYMAMVELEQYKQYEILVELSKIIFERQIKIKKLDSIKSIFICKFLIKYFPQIMIWNYYYLCAYRSLNGYTWYENKKSNDSKNYFCIS